MNPVIIRYYVHLDNGTCSLRREIESEEKKCKIKKEQEQNKQPKKKNLQGR